MTIEHIRSFICMKVVFGFAFDLSHAFIYYIFVRLKTSRCSNVRRIMWINEMKYDRLMKFSSTNFSKFWREVYHFNGGVFLILKEVVIKEICCFFCWFQKVETWWDLALTRRSKIPLDWYNNSINKRFQQNFHYMHDES
jgi:hypothetical protein